MNKINFKKWAFRFTIWLLILNTAIAYLIINHTDFPGVENNTGIRILFFSILSTILLILCITFIIISTIRKEQKNYQYWISVIGILIFGVFPFIASFF
ncbi:hypothetical protein [uncultured Tenacibaculum sp.]|uniref:hypothetical protein n=1 Tax=uncultured Tenacibaculum sp. TaxID=174713 RepID=UPI0026167A0E|nr:hypothetical protein [uncultured Tenacibaculum sp.]